MRFILCFFGLHRTGPWGDPHPAVVVGSSNNASIQERRCRDCNANFWRAA